MKAMGTNAMGDGPKGDRAIAFLALTRTVKSYRLQTMLIASPIAFRNRREILDRVCPSQTFCLHMDVLLVPGLTLNIPLLVSVLLLLSPFFPVG